MSMFMIDIEIVKKKNFFGQQSGKSTFAYTGENNICFSLSLSLSFLDNGHQLYFIMT